jgi:hypothetical protein
VMSKFGIQTLVQFNCNFWRNLDSNRVTLKHFEPERAYSRDVVSRRAASTLGVVRTRARRGAGKSTGSWPGAVGTVRLRVVTRANSHCRRPVSYLLRSCPWPTNNSKLLPSLHSSSHTTHGLAPPHISSDSEPQRRHRHRPSPGTSPANPRTPIGPT